jgi:hypothetical protein
MACIPLLKIPRRERAGKNTTAGGGVQRGALPHREKPAMVASILKSARRYVADFAVTRRGK